MSLWCFQVRLKFLGIFTRTVKKPHKQFYCPATEIENVSKTPLEPFNNNQMKAKPGNCHFICSSSVKTCIMTENKQIRNSYCVKLLGVFFDSKLTFQPHIDKICKKASQNLNVISRVTMNDNE